MPTWNAEQYLQFEKERTRPCRDLVSHIDLVHPRRLIDLGCGPGNSTSVLAERWPDAEITGLDSSPEMIAAATRQYPNIKWLTGDIAKLPTGESHDLILANAVLHWLPGHESLFPQLMRNVAPGGALAVQMPANFDAPAHRLMRELAATRPWQNRLPENIREWFVHPPGFYYDTLAHTAARLDLWTTEYQHVLPSAQAIVEWYKGTGLRPYLDALKSAADREEFLTDYSGLIKGAFPPQADGKVILPFQRLFLIAYAR